MYFKKNWGSMAAKEPPLGRVDIFQTSPNEIENLLGRKLPWEAGNFQVFWAETSFDVDTGKRADLWEQEGYPIHAVGLSLPNYCIADS